MRYLSTHHRHLKAIGFASFAAIAGAALVVACEDETTHLTGDPDASTPFDGGSSDASSPEDGGAVVTCAPTSGPGTEHSSVSGDEIWTAESGPHRITTGIDVREGSTLTIEPCAVVELDEAGSILVEGTLDARGEDGRPIAFKPREAGKRWRKIEVRKGSLRLAYATVEGGGALNGGRPTQEGMIDVRGDQNEPAQPIFDARHVTLRGSEAPAVWLREGGGFTAESTEVVVTGGATYPMVVWGRALRTLPTGRFSGNARDVIVIPGSVGRDDIKEDTVVRKLDVPYQVGSDIDQGELRVEGTTTAPLLTLEAGVELRFVPRAVLKIHSGTSGPAKGALAIRGTAAQPVTLTSAAATPVAGDWVGVWLGGVPDARTSIEHAVIRFAGGVSGANSFGCPSPLSDDFSNAAAILFLGGAPASAIVTNTVVEDSAAEGIVRGWIGEPTDFLPTNQFTRVARCHQSFPAPVGASCPKPAPCPR